MKALMAANCINKYPDYTKPFHIYTETSDYQLGADIIQDGEPIAYYSKKITDTQRNYTTTEKELLAIVMCLKKYHKILQGGSDAYFHIDEDNEMMDLFLNLPPMGETHNPIQMQNSSNHQLQDAELQQQH